MNVEGIAQLLLRLREADIRLTRDGDALKISVAKGSVVSDELKVELRARKQEILRFLKEADIPSGAAPSINPRDARSKPVLSFGQERVWMMHELNRDLSSPYDTLTWNLLLRGKLDTQALRQSFEKVIARHEPLRTTFFLGDGEPVQIIHEDSFVFMTEVDSSVASREAIISKEILGAANTLFDLTEGPLFKVSLIKLQKDEYLLIVVLHHIVFDAWSIDILTRELSAVYNSLVSGSGFPLDPLAISYADFAVWQREWMQGAVLDQEVAYWKKKLFGLDTLELPLDHPRGASQTYSGRRETLSVPDSLSKSLVAFAAERGATQFMIWLAALGCLLSRYTQQTDIAIGTPITTRDREELQGLIGYFLNTLVMRINLDGSPSFEHLLDSVKKTVLDGFSHQHLPFELLVEHLDLQRDPTRSPLFQVLFVMQNQSGETLLKFSDLGVEVLDKEIATSHFDLEFYVDQSGDSFTTSCIYNPELFQQVSIEGMLRHYVNLLMKMISTPDKPVCDLEFLGDGEHRQMLTEWNDTAHEWLGEPYVYQTIEAQAKRMPEAIAISDGERTLTYRELDQRSDIVVSELLKRQVKPGDIVGICAYRSVDLVVSMLGIWKAGAAYLPLDYDHPQDRLAYILQESAAVIVVTQKVLLDRLPPHDSVVLLDQLDFDQSCEPVLQAEPGRIAYVIYTSGSTGAPKGVRVHHSGVRNFLHSMLETPGMNAADRVIALTTITFDIHVLEVMASLMAGAHVRLVSREVSSDARALAEVMVDFDATVMQATPTTWHMLVESGWKGKKDLKLLTGGEPLSVELAHELAVRCKELWNMYGPTETTVWSSVCQIDALMTEVTVGKPIHNTQFYVLDATMRLVPFGVRGELYIGGDGVTDGYVARPELTEERFVGDPFNPGQRLYRTGDIASLGSDGEVRLYGRSDFQVKLRGFRIELGEVESVLTAHPAVTSAVVVVREDTPSDERLVAYATYHMGEKPSVDEMHKYFKDRLPFYMIPATVVWIDTFPVLASGKINRKALPEPPKVVQRTIKGHSVLPQGELEIKLAKIWVDLLGVENIQAYDMFFDMGGNSLLSLKVVERFEREAGYRISPVELVNQTLRQIIAGLKDKVAQKKIKKSGLLLGTFKNAFGGSTK